MSQFTDKIINRELLVEDNEIALNKVTFKDFLVKDMREKIYERVLEYHEKRLMKEIEYRDEIDVYISALFAFDRVVYLSNGNVYISQGAVVHLLDLPTFKETLYALCIANETNTKLCDEICNEFNLVNVDQSFFFETKKDLERKDSGQAKIAYSALTPFIVTDPERKKDYKIPGQMTDTYRHLQILVVGSSSSSSYAGASYLILAEMLSKRGHNGTIDLYDPLDNPGEIQWYNFKLKFFGEKYVYTDKLTYDVILDDIYEGKEEFEEPPQGVSFAIIKEGKMIYTKDIQVDNISIVHRIGNLLSVHEKFNYHDLPYPRKLFYVSHDHNYMIRKHGRFFSTKFFFGECPDDCSILDQPFYYKQEKRLVNREIGDFLRFKYKKMPLVHSCSDCFLLGNLISCLGLEYSDYLKVRALAHQCLPIKGVKSLMAENYILSAARRKTDIRVAASEVARKCGISVKKVDNIIQGMAGRMISIVGTSVSYITLNNRGKTSPASFFLRNKISLMSNKKFFSLLGSYADTLPFDTDGGIKCVVYYDRIDELRNYLLYLTYDQYKLPPDGWVKINQIDLFSLYTRYEDASRFNFC